MEQRRPRSSSGTVIVVGAGISGLTAAWRLKSAGINAVVLEQATRPGGRIHSINVNRCIMEAGANFVTDAYRIIPQLAHEARVPLRKVSNRSAIAAHSRLHAFRANWPPSAIRAGVLPLHAALGEMPGLARFATLSRRRRTFDPLSWLDLDKLTAEAWAESLGISTLMEHAWRPAYHGFYFQEAREASAAAVAAMASHGLRQHTLTIPGGLSTLTNAMAARLDVRTGVQVFEIAEARSKAVIRTSEGEFQADGAVVALPGAELEAVMELAPQEEAVARTPYSAGLLVGLGLNRGLVPHELGGAYGVLMHPNEGTLAALCVASRAGHAVDDDGGNSADASLQPSGKSHRWGDQTTLDCTDSGRSGIGTSLVPADVRSPKAADHAHGIEAVRGRDVVTCMFSDGQARDLAARSDADIIAAARRALLTWEPSLRNAFVNDGATSNAVVRIPYAMPTSTPGRLTAVAKYRRWARQRRIILAGDSLAWPWSDSAAFAGAWAAAALLAGTLRQ